MNSSLTSLAARNVFRNARRSLLTAGAVFIGVVASVALRGFANGYLRGMREMMIQSNLGAVQVHAAGFKKGEKGLLELTLPRDDAFMARMASVPGVVAVAPRLFFEGMLNNGALSTMVSVGAFDTALENKVCPARFSTERASSPLTASDDGKALLGRALSEALDARAGASLTLLSATAAGASNALDVTVKGVFTTSNPLESKRVVAITLGHAQALTGLPDRVNEYALAVTDIDHAEEVSARVQAALGPEYEVVSWRQRLPIFGEIFERIDSLFAVVYAVLFVLVLSGILNTMLMSVYERVREIGTMLAVGARRGEVMRMFLLESALLGGAGGAAGALIGVTITVALNLRGISFTPPGTSAPISIQPFVAPQYVALSVAVAVGGAVLAALVPALRAARLSPVEALRSV